MSVRVHTFSSRFLFSLSFFFFLFERTFMKARVSETKEGLRIEEATGESLGRAAVTLETL